MDKFNEKYMLNQFINKNKYVETYKAIKSTSNEMVVLKVFNEDIDIDDLNYELRILKSMDNPNIININDVGSFVENKKVRHYVELESFSSKTLSDYLLVNTFSNEEAVKILKQIAEGLKEFHFENFIFENLSCDNINIYNNKIVKIDTLSYLYEIISGKANHKKLSEKDDIFALGKILYELVTGKNFKVGKGKDEISDKELLLIIERCTNKKYEDLNALITDLNSYIEYGGISSSFNNIQEDYKYNDEYEEENSNKLKYIKIIGGLLACILIFFIIATFLNGSKIFNFN